MHSKASAKAEALVFSDDKKRGQQNGLPVCLKTRQAVRLKNFLFIQKLIRPADGTSWGRA